MKKLILSTIIALTTTFGLNAQLTEGHISYKIDISSDNPDMAAYMGMFQGSTMESYINNDMTRSEMKLGTMQNTITITNLTNQKSLMLMSGMMGKKAIEMDLKKMNEDSEAKMPKFEITKTTETKEILGYICTKTILTTENGVELAYWLTNEITGNIKGQQGYFEGIDGFPLQFEIVQGPMRMTMTTTAIVKSLTKEEKSTLFSMKIPEGYTVTTIEELSKMGGGM